jgi:hypothetical protein
MRNSARRGAITATLFTLHITSIKEIIYPRRYLRQASFLRALPQRREQIDL